MFQGKRNGYDMNLYRSSRQRWIAGVCGGVAENTGWPVWLVRLAAFMLFSITGSLAFFAYIAAIVMLASRDDIEESGNRRSQQSSRACSGFSSAQARQGRHEGVKEKVFNYGKTSSGQVKDVTERLKELDGRLQSMERYVTSKKYQFDQELRRS